MAREDMRWLIGILLVILPQVKTGRGQKEGWRGGEGKREPGCAARGRFWDLYGTETPYQACRGSVTQTTTAPASASSPGLESPPSSNWKFITAAVVVTGLLLLGLAVLVALYLRKRQERARKGENESHHTCDDTSAQKAEPMVVSDEDAGTICYASVIHVHSLGFKDSIYANIHPAQRPRPEPLPSVEYTSIARGRHQPSLAATLEEVADREAEFPGQ
ncbi:uncharacterized protein RHO17_023424 [Thomomys bottae]